VKRLLIICDVGPHRGASRWWLGRFILDIIALLQFEGEVSRMSGRLYRALSQAHQQVQAKIETEERSRVPDWYRISELKRRKLSIKDRMRSILEHGRDALPLRLPTNDVRRPSHGLPLSRDA
jgi:uncharacterized protein YdcH (DUF465 family)